jgi:hypothetical protein
MAENFQAVCFDLDGWRGGNGRIWRRLTGIDRIALDGQGARIISDPDRRMHGRVAYGVEWDHPGLADLEVEILPPPYQPGADANCRAGLVFWQDARNYIIVNLWLNGGGADGSESFGAVSSFFYLDGSEDLYDAAWTNVGFRIRHGVPCRLRVGFDGDHYLARLDGRTVLYRTLSDIYPRLSRLAIRKVGIAANWEWGVDTGSRILSFTARCAP